MSVRRLLYTLFLYVIFPLVLLRLLWRSRANIDYRKRLSERLGFIPKNIKLINSLHDQEPILWLHAVSVGEVIAAKPLIQALLLEFPQNRMLVTTTTPTGSDRVSSIFAEHIKNQSLIHVYFPYDLLGSVSRFIKAFKPKILIVVETEIWPNLYAKCYQQNIPVVMVNARLSEASVSSYKKIQNLVAETLSKVSLIAVRSKSDTERFLQLGASSNKIEAIGNIKYDLSVDDKQVSSAKKYSSILKMHDGTQRLVFVAASTHKGEDEKILFVYKSLLKQFPELLLVLVPRHPERFESVFQDCIEYFPKEIQVIRHSGFNTQSSDKNKTDKNSFEQGMQQVDVIVGDSMGEMQLWYSLADIVFIGGSLVKTGGHNPLEATIFGVPVCSGPHMFNFEDIATELQANDLLLICDDEHHLVQIISNNFKKLNSVANIKSGKYNFKIKADYFLQQHQGVTSRLISRIETVLSKST